MSFFGSPAEDLARQEARLSELHQEEIDELNEQHKHKIEAKDKIIEDQAKVKARLIEDHERVIRQMQFDTELKIANLKKDHEITLKEKAFELTHHKDVELKTMADSLTAKDVELQVAKKENEIMKQVTDLNGDILDVKDVVNKLIEKLPQINLTSLTVAQNGSPKSN